MRARTCAVVADDFPSRFREAASWAERAYGWMQAHHLRKLFACDLLFVHNIFQAEVFLRLCPKQARQKMVLMTHAPTSIAYEIAGDLCPDIAEELLAEEVCVQDMVNKHLELMLSLKAVVWPCAEAQEGYPEWFSLYQEGKTSHAFVETGTPTPPVGLAPDTLRRAWGVEPGQRIALFLGRPHPHKGFDLFVAWAAACRAQRNREWVFVFAGKEPVTGRDLSAIRPVGYVTDNRAAYLAADLVLFPNRYSYFDLGLLEAMSLGAKIAYAPTGGHQTLTDACPALPHIPVGDAEEVWPVLEAIAEHYARSEEIQRQMIEVWSGRFALKPFLDNHVRLVKQMTGVY